MLTPGDRLKRTILWLKSQGFIKEQNDVAIYLGINKSYLSQLVNNQKPVSEKFVTRYKEVFDVINVDYLIPGKGKMVNIGQVRYHSDLVMVMQKKQIEQLEKIQVLQAKIIELQNKLGANPAQKNKDSK
jgi:transcriptional regulator with XRE-family HTH domain